MAIGEVNRQVVNSVPNERSCEVELDPLIDYDLIRGQVRRSMYQRPTRFCCQRIGDWRSTCGGMPHSDSEVVVVAECRHLRWLQKGGPDCRTRVKSCGK